MWLGLESISVFMSKPPGQLVSRPSVEVILLDKTDEYGYDNTPTGSVVICHLACQLSLQFFQFIGFRHFLSLLYCIFCFALRFSWILACAKRVFTLFQFILYHHLHNIANFCIYVKYRLEKIFFKSILFIYF